MKKKGTFEVFSANKKHKKLKNLFLEVYSEANKNKKLIKNSSKNNIHESLKKNGSRILRKNEYLLNLPMYIFGIEEKSKKNHFEKLMSKHLMT
jgi:hypothetical protein